MTCPYCKHEIQRYQRPYEVNGIAYHEWCYQNKICRETSEQGSRQPKESRSSDE